MRAREPEAQAKGGGFRLTRRSQRLWIAALRLRFGLTAWVAGAAGEPSVRERADAPERATPECPNSAVAGSGASGRLTPPSCPSHPTAPGVGRRAGRDAGDGGRRSPRTGRRRAGRVGCGRAISPVARSGGCPAASASGSTPAASRLRPPGSRGHRPGCFAPAARPNEIRAGGWGRSGVERQRDGADTPERTAGSGASGHSAPLRSLLPQPPKPNDVRIYKLPLPPAVATPGYSALRPSPPACPPSAPPSVGSHRSRLHIG